MCTRVFLKPSLASQSGLHSSTDPPPSLYVHQQKTMLLECIPSNFMAWICLLSKDDEYRYISANVGGLPQPGIQFRT
jgi:hypothetical protein